MAAEERIMQELYEVVDPRPIAAEAPYTFLLPPTALVDVVRSGDHVKAIFRAVPPSETVDAERMWVRVKSLDGECLVGELDSQPKDMPLLATGTTIRLPKSHVISVLLKNPCRKPKGALRRREYWDRGLVDQCVFDGKVKVGYLYREPPDLTREGDKFPDSGWRIRGDDRNCSKEEFEAREAAYVALGLVLNKDDSWLHLIDEPVGSSFEKDFAAGVFFKAI